MVERTFRELDLQFKGLAEEAPTFNGLRRVAASAFRALDEVLSTKPRQQARFHTFNLQLEIEVLAGADRGTLASEVV